MSIVNDKMSDTPETDAAWTAESGNGLSEVKEISRKLERERDEARKELSSIHRWIERNHADGFIDSLTYLQNLERVADNWYDRIDAIETDARRFVRERDEVQKAVNGLCDHFGVSPANTTLLAVEVLRIQREREEAITRRMETIMQCELYEQERDEAREKAASWIREWRELRELWRTLDREVNNLMRERDEAREALKYIAHSGLSARHIEDYAKDFLSKK
jgi:chromosome segregation ATPase